jgi:RNA-directed DNA polymerase
MDALTSDFASGVWQNWNGLDWSSVHRTVRRLQTRIAKAVRNGDWRDAKRLQRLLVRSTSGKALAVRQVTENRGRKTPGVDRETWSTPEHKWKAVQSLQTRGYRPLPLKRVNIPKTGRPHGPKRSLGIPTMKDRAMQALHLLALDPIAESTADANSYGFRSCRSTADAITQCMNVLSRKHSSRWLLEGDIRGCFDNISHDWLRAHVPTDKRILGRWLKAGFIEHHRLFPTEAGTPQGGNISPALANMTLDGLEKLLTERFKSRRHKVHVVRYADDFIVTGSSKELLENEVRPVVEAFLGERGLELSCEKTRITHIADGFDFLGWNLRWVSDGLRANPSKKNRLTLYDKLRREIRALRTAEQANLILKLNPIIRGWAQYHQPVSVAEVFRKMDHLLFGALWRWSKRRHPNKSRRWIKRRYFRKEGARDWVFAAGKLRLWRFTDFKHRDYYKVKSEATPYDPRWESYFAERLGRQMKQTIMGRRRLYWVWKQQDGKCPICHQPVTKETGWNLHHRQWRCNGGSDRLANLALLHPTCHRQHHALHRGKSEPNQDREACLDRKLYGRSLPQGEITKAA